MSRVFGAGGGTVLPGHVIPRIDPTAAHRLAGRLPHGVVVLSGTNGKTTTARMVSEIALAAGLRPIHNRSGSNLMSGITAALAAHCDLSGRPEGDLGLLEVDEAHVGAAIDAVRPRVLALTNVFRDQLDRYGEVDLIAKTWQRAISRLDPEATLVLNADDPIVAQLADAAPCAVLTFGMEHRDPGGPDVPHDADRRLCPRCAARLAYDWSYYGHVGHYACPACGWRRPVPMVSVRSLETDAVGHSHVVLETSGAQLEVAVPLPGAYNAYNALASAAIAVGLHLPTHAIAEGIGRTSAVFGRQEEVAVGQGRLVMTLVKNPIGFNQVLQSLQAAEAPGLLVIAINDLFADGTDVSWLWDVDFEVLAPGATPVLCTGTRAHDMAVRLKYARASAEPVDVAESLEAALATALRCAQQGQRVVVLPTYTAMLSMRADLQRRGLVVPFWEN